MYDMGSKLRAVRERRGLTQRELAKRILRSTAAVSSYESNKQVPPTDVLVSICEVLHVPITYFVEYDCNDTYSSIGLSPLQRELVDLLFQELTQENTFKESLTTRQMEIVRRMMQEFSK